VTLFNTDQHHVRYLISSCSWRRGGSRCAIVPAIELIAEIEHLRHRLSSSLRRIVLLVGVTSTCADASTSVMRAALAGVWYDAMYVGMYSTYIHIYIPAISLPWQPFCQPQSLVVTKGTALSSGSGAQVLEEALTLDQGHQFLSAVSLSTEKLSRNNPSSSREGRTLCFFFAFVKP
jgi:hypothetical protein